ncbi:glycosyl hydrolase family 28-related protein [Terriglobus albidus]|uniref:glycosyl hydrolase family 28-related protein n=1 Tax=Terriglobus albidus TaxID=1592106 RepID=UPI0021DFDD00|nr:glycosyl hydrolase family 28-related protein [Terriglobus albidus]
MRVWAWVCAATLIVAAVGAEAKSVYTQRPDDPHAVYLENGAFGVKGDGASDDSDALQAAINKVQETTAAGIVYLPHGRYRLTKTIYVWTGIRIVGYGAERPVLFLAPNTPGFQDGHDFLGTGRYMVQFASNRPQRGGPVVDANEFTFYSGMSNVDFEIGDGNAAAIAIRFHVAQHSSLNHIDLHIGHGRAALEDVGNQASDLKIYGGEYGIISVKTSPAWQFLLMDSILEGQRKAAIHTQEVGMTLIRNRIAKTPVAVEISKGMPEQLYGRDLVLEDISRAGVVVGNVWAAHSQITLDSIACNNVVKMLENGESATGYTEIKAPGRFWREAQLTLGLEIGNDGREAGYALRHREIPLKSAASLAKTDIPELPAMNEWVNVHTLGVQGDGGTDDTPALQKAIDTHRVLYLPEGMYRLTGTLHLKPDTVLIGMNPVTTMLILLNQEPAFSGTGAEVPMVESARGGNAMMMSIGIGTGFGNPRAGGVMWRAGASSFLDDVNFSIGRGRANNLVSPNAPPTSPRTGPRQETSESEQPSLWVGEGGGGLFRGIWTANTTANAGLVVENTSTPSIVYQMSCEHHMHFETRFHQAQNWTVYALQTEEEKPAGAEAFAIELVNSQHILFTNLFMYRVSRNTMPKLNAVESKGSSDIRLENVHVFSMTRLAYDNAVMDFSSGVKVRTHDFTTFLIGPELKPGAPVPMPEGVFAANAKLEKLADGFSNAAGLTVDEKGTLYFTDAAMQKIYRWDDTAKKAEIVSADVPDPRVVQWVKPGLLLAMDYSKSVYAVPLDGGKAQKIAEGTIEPTSGKLAITSGFHNDIGSLQRQINHSGYIFAPRSNMAVTGFTTDEHRGYFTAPQSDVTLVAGGTWLPYMQASQMGTLAVGGETVVVSEDDDKTYRVKLDNIRTLSAGIFAERGGTGIAQDAAGHVFIAAGQVYIYDATGKQIGVVEIPERPSSLAIGGADRKMLFIGARGGLYSLHLK